MTLSR